MVNIPEKETDLITECQIRRFSTEEALAYLEKNGVTISERTYRRRKNQIESNAVERILEEGQNGRFQQLVSSLDTLKKVEKEYWNLFSSTQKEVLKERILKAIDKIQERFTDHYREVGSRANLIENKRRSQEEERKKTERYSDLSALSN